LAQNKEKTIKPETITCEEFLAMDKDVQPLVVYWIDGYENSGDAKTEGVVIHIFERPISTVVSECKKAPKDALSQRRSRRISRPTLSGAVSPLKRQRCRGSPRMIFSPA